MFSHPIWILEIPQETHQIMFGFWCLFSFHPPNLWVFLLGFFVSILKLMFFYPIPPKSHTTIINQPPTTPHHPPPSLPPNHSNTPRWRRRTTWANSSPCWNFCGRTSWPKSQRSGRETTILRRYIAAVVDIPSLKLLDGLSFLDGLFSGDIVSFREGKFM